MKETDTNGNAINLDATSKGKSINTIKKWKILAIYLFLYDAVAVNISYFAALLLRFDFKYTAIPSVYLNAFEQFAPVHTIFALLLFHYLHLYRALWQFASYTELNKVTLSSALTFLFHLVGMTVFVQRMPISYYVFGFLMQTVLLVFARFITRFVMHERSKVRLKTKAAKNAMIIGAGAAGQIIIRELKNASESGAYPCCIIDDDPNKWERYLGGVPIVGGRHTIIDNVKKYKIDQILFAIPTAPLIERKKILRICNQTGCELKRLPGIYQLANGEVTVSKLRPVAVEDLLGRDTIKVNMGEISEAIKDKTVLVTGGGGSIGSELCRQIARYLPKTLIILDIYENNAYEIEQELKIKHPELNLHTVIGSVRDDKRLDEIFKTYQPDIVYHAAAHKHVPLMENSPCEAIKNNVVGTYKTAYAALKHKVSRFVLISTDKAVNPTNIMGASKRMCEMIIQSMDAVSKADRFDLLPSLNISDVTPMDGQMAVNSMVYPSNYAKQNEGSHLNIECVNDKERTGTQFVAVRFGNVLGSNGSVIPLFKKQIEAGGPVTVTHPDITRFFMTIPEAVRLVLQAGTYAWGGEIFVLDMGDPVKIDTLARNLIKLSGYEPDHDIKIVYTGLRPGEKLYEEKLMEEEGIKKTDNELIHIGKPIPFNTEVFLTQLKSLASAAYQNADNISELVENIVSTYQPSTGQPKGQEKSCDLEIVETQTVKEKQEKIPKKTDLNNVINY
jgi:FlaA1/EpsC-like NDP-sugar epimerase